ncbi:hypothetical protein, partial [Klebsiella michiganensis]
VTTFPEKKRQHQRVLSLVCLSSGSRRKYRQLKMVAGVHSIYVSLAVCDPVARAGASRRPREQAHRKWQNFPESASAYLTGLCIVSRLRSRRAAGK